MDRVMNQTRNAFEGERHTQQPNSTTWVSNTHSECKAVVVAESRLESATDDNEVRSDETRYLINRWEAEGRVECSLPETEGEVDPVGATTVEEEGSGETLYRINRELLGDWERNEEENITEAVGGGGRDDTDLAYDVELVNQGERLSEISSEEEDSIEVGEAKTVWYRGGISFESSDEEEIHERLVRRRGGGKKRLDLRPKLPKQGKKPPFIQGRTQTTRKLCLGAKPKSK
ncbi:hypothetical protein PIB30_040771 [Stylosanthes scabra]|uniref:Uncharacterized protein n=1 Tax=Stylosanthes scabra TaxID=79078 RepID=A0ABU6ZDE1_9FABA|nr:hypothetical protein [Stylosanthes scabra]